MPIIVLIIVIFIIINASKSNKNSNTNTNSHNTGNSNPYRTPNQGMPRNTSNIQNNPYSAPNRQAPQANPYSSQMRQASQANPYPARMQQAPQTNPYSSQMRQAPQTNPYSSQMRQAPQTNPYPVRMQQAPKTNPYPSQNRQDLSQLKERLSSKYGPQIQNKRQTQTNTRTSSGKTPQNQQRPMSNSVQKINDSQKTVSHNQQQSAVVPNHENQNKALQAEMISQDFLSSLGTTNTLVITETPSSLMMGISDYDFSFWGIGLDESYTASTPEDII